MNISAIVKKGEYYDSISIMLIAKQVAAIGGVADSAVVLGTPENKSLLASSGLFTKECEAASDTDVIVACRLQDGISGNDLSAKVEEVFRALKKQGAGGTEYSPRSIEGAMHSLPGANLAMISVAGRYAGDLAMDALEHGLHVFLFSDNVPLEQEIALKTFARKKNLFVMGPDCGTAIINGVPLGFANVVNRGSVGIVAASGTGLQEVSCLLSNAGAGVSQAIGTGGRDVKNNVGGIMFLAACDALIEDPATSVILLVSKPPDPGVLQTIIRKAGTSNKPVVGVFLGAPADALAKSVIHPAATLEEGALAAAALASGRSAEDARMQLAVRDAGLRKEAVACAARLQPGQKYLRALFSGGTFCDEAQLCARQFGGELWSNTPVGQVKKLASAWKSTQHTIVDLGDDEFTVGKPHPMIDYSTRSKRFAAEASDPEAAVILFDIVLGYGSTLSPLADILPAIEEARTIASKGGRFLPMVCSVTGTDGDPQRRSAVADGLRNAGVTVRESNASASAFAVAVASRGGAR